jgi:hypothetical protein
MEAVNLETAAPLRKRHQRSQALPNQGGQGLRVLSVIRVGSRTAGYFAQEDFLEMALQMVRVPLPLQLLLGVELSMSAAPITPMRLLALRSLQASSAGEAMATANSATAPQPIASRPSA